MFFSKSRGGSKANTVPYRGFCFLKKLNIKFSPAPNPNNFHTVPYFLYTFKAGCDGLCVESLVYWPAHIIVSVKIHINSFRTIAAHSLTHTRTSPLHLAMRMNYLMLSGSLKDTTEVQLQADSLYFT